MTDPAPPLAYSVKDAAAALSVSRNLIDRAINHNLIRCTRIGRAVRIPAAEVERVAIEGLPAVPRNYIRRTEGPTKVGRPRKKV